MGFYDDGEYKSSRKRNKGRNSLLRLVGVVAISAAVGSGSTLAAVPLLMQNHVLPTSSAMTDPNLVTASYSPSQTVNVSINDAVVQAVKKDTPTVVGVVNYQNITNYAGVTSLQEYGVGSGVIFDPRGYIVTNNHVVQGATKVEVVLYDKKHVWAKVIGTDPYTDLAVLKIPSADITTQNVAQFGNSATLQAGEPAIAIGNPAGLDFADTVTEGVISATQRTMPVTDEATGQVLGQETVLQTDAAINPGNSGGPLLNILGQVIGINSSKISATGFEGMGFAIPINEVKTIASQIIATGHAQHPALGIEGGSLASVPQQLQPNVPVTYGVYVSQVDSASAKASGIKVGDVIVAIDGQKVTGLTDLRNILWDNYKPGDTVTVTAYRKQQKLNFTIHLGVLAAPTASANQLTPSSSGSGQSASGQSSSGGSTITIPGLNGSGGSFTFTFP